MWEVNLNTILLVLVFVMVCIKIGADAVMLRSVRRQKERSEHMEEKFDRLDKAIRENITIQTNYNAIAAELVKSYHHLTEGTVKDAKEAMTTLAGDVKDVVAVGVTDAAKVAATTTASRDKKQEELAAQMEVIHVATNSLVDKLVAAEGEKKYAEGVKSETDKGDRK